MDTRCPLQDACIGAWRSGALLFVLKNLSESADQVPALLAKGVEYLEAGNIDAAKALFEAVLRLDASIAEAMTHLGTIALNRGDLATALILLQRSLRIMPEQAVAHNNIAFLYRKMERLEDALEHYDRAIGLGLTEAVANRANILRLLHRYDEALECFRDAERLNPSNPGIFLSQEPAHLYKRDFGMALYCLDRALTLKPNFPEAKFRKAELLLMQGKFREGWTLFEARWQMKQAQGKLPRFTCPLWLGDVPLEGRKILLWAEQGFGDMIQFLRFVPMVVEQGAKVVVSIPPSLVSLAASIHSSVEIVEHGPPPLDLDFYVPLMSLPLALKLEAGDVAPRIPYLWPSEEKRHRWQSQMGQHSQKRVGLVWFGSMAGTGAIAKGMAFEEILPLVDVPADFFSLQKQISEEAAAFQRHDRVIDLSGYLNDFEDTAAAMLELDLIVTVDTAAAHLAGALGKPVWVMRPHLPEWRWPDDGVTPWYPTARIFRQTTPLDWEPVISEVKKELQAWARL